MKRIDALILMMGDDDISEITIKICGTYCPVKTWIKIYDYLNADLLVSKEDLQETKDEAEKKDCNFTASLEQDHGIDTKPVANSIKPVANSIKPVKKVTAGSKKREKLDDGKLLALAKAGWTKEKIAEELKVGVATVYNHLKKAREEGRL